MKTFPIGGVHPRDNKISATQPIIPMELPAEVTIYTSQHIGAPANPCVAKGDKVLTGQIIATAAGFVSANVHSSVSGTVKSVGTVADGGGVSRMAVVIEREADEWVDSVDHSDTLIKECNLSSKEIIEKISSAGLVGMGGATFPTQVKLVPPAGKKAEAIIVNGVECEPYLTADHRVMLERGDEVLIACQIVMKATGAAKCYVGIENNKPDVIRSLSDKAHEYQGVEIVPLKLKYPQGGEKQLIKAITGRSIPSGALPIDVGVIVQNVGTMYAVYQAVQKNRPLIDRVVTVTGVDVARPSNLLVRIGTPIRTLIDFCGGEPESTGKVVNGGPMMGKAIYNTATSVTKGTSGILLMPAENAKRVPSSPCISCGKCVEACPMGLEPYLIAKVSKLQLWERLEAEKVTDCIECGCCAFTCPAGLPLLDYVRLGKAETLKIIRNRK